MRDTLRPNIPELKIKDFETYKSYCCGVCRQLRMDYGFVTRFLLRHDLVVFALLADSLAGRQATCIHARCPKHPFAKRCMLCHTQGIRLAAQVNVLLCWHRATDDVNLLSSRHERQNAAFCKFFLKRAYYKAVAQCPAVERLIQQERDHGEAIKLSRTTKYEIASEPLANVFSALFVYSAPDDDNARKALRYVGFYVGRIVYLLSAAERYDSDRESGRYNVFIENGLTKQSAIENAKRQCNQSVGQLAKAYNMLDVKLNRTLLDNIIFLGLEQTVNEVGRPQTSRFISL